MSETPATLILDINAAGLADGSDPWMHLVPAGRFVGADGRGPYVLKDAGAVIAASMAGGKVLLDECHSTDLAAPKGLPAPARGWIVEMQARPDGIWGRVELNATGKSLMAEQAYRGVSPAMMVTKSSPAEVRAIARASLTNDPNLPLHTLHHKADTMSLPASLLARLGLTADADEAAIAAAIGTSLDQVETHSKTIATLAAAAGAKADAKPDELVVHIHQVVKTAEAAGDSTKLAETVVTLQSQLDTLRADNARTRAVAYVDGAIRDGKPIKALRDHYITRHAKDPAAVETEINALASVHSGGIDPARRQAANPTADVTDVGDIVTKATLHQREHPGKAWADCVLAVSGG
jgi:phage I-like protein